MVLIHMTTVRSIQSVVMNYAQAKVFSYGMIAMRLILELLKRFSNGGRLGETWSGLPARPSHFGRAVDHPGEFLASVRRGDIIAM